MSVSVSVCAHARACPIFKNSLLRLERGTGEATCLCDTDDPFAAGSKAERWSPRAARGHGRGPSPAPPPGGRRGAEGTVRVEGRGTKPRGGPARPRGAPSGKRCSPAAAFVLNSRGKKLHQRFAAFHLPSDLRPSSWRPRPFHPAELHTLPPRPRGVTTSLHQVFAAAWQLSSGTSPRLLAPTLGQERGLSVQGTPTGRSPSMRQLSQETLKPSPEMLKH